MLRTITTLDEYMARYGTKLGEQAAKSTNPLHVPGQHDLIPMDLLRTPFEAQAHCITAGVRQMKRDKTVKLIGECGTGKTLMAQAMAHTHADGRSYRAMVFCPPHLTNKWKREIEETIPYAEVTILKSYTDLLGRRPDEPRAGYEWFIVSQNRAKMGPGWTAKFVKQRRPVGIPFCPRCGQAIMKMNKKENREVPVPVDDLNRRKHNCQNCGEQLWQCSRRPKQRTAKWPIATYINRRLPNWLDYLIVDEMHEEKGDNTAQANAMGQLASAAKRCIGLTGTLIGGYADNIRTLLFRLSPTTVIDDGQSWSDSMRFSEQYGRIETTVQETGKDVDDFGADNKQSRGSSRKSTKKVRPGIMPSLFGKHLIDKCIFLGLSEVADQLPELEERTIPIEMDDQQAEAYKRTENALTMAMKAMMQRGDKRLLGTMLSTLLAYPDHPFGWQEIGYYESNPASGAQVWVPICTPQSLDEATLRPKEKQLLVDVLKERAEGNQSWVFTTMTGKRDVAARLEKLFKKAGLKTAVLRSEVSTQEREAWIAKHGDCDVVISHPALVQTGLDLFDRGGNHNFSTLMFYMTGYSIYTLRQASRRAWRIGQEKLCRVLYYYYAGTMQERAMTLMGKKLSAAEAIEGKFSSEGLVAMTGDEGSIEMAMVKSLVNKIDEGDTARVWAKVSGFTPTSVKAQKSTVPIIRRPPPMPRRPVVIDLDPPLELPAIVGEQMSLAFDLSDNADDVDALLCTTTNHVLVGV